MQKVIWKWKGAGIMKKFIKTLGFICAILTALGMVFVTIGIINGGRESVKSDLRVDKLAIYFNVDKWFDSDEDENMISISKDSVVRIEKEKNEVSSLKVKAKYGEVKINQWNETDFGIENKTKKLDVKYEVVDGVLNISVSGKVGIFNNYSGVINLYIPQNKLNSVDISVGAGELDCSGIVADSLKIDVGAGEGKIKNSEFDKCDIDVGLGELDIEDTTVNEMNVDCGMGEVDCSLNNSYTDFDYALKVGAGEIKLGSEKYEGISNSVKLSNNAGRTMDIDCGMGEVAIEFMK